MRWVLAVFLGSGLASAQPRIEIADPPFALYAGTSVPLHARVWLARDTVPAPAPRIVWSTSNSAVAWITDLGTLQLVAPGRVMVRARSGEATAERALDVLENPVRQLTIRAPAGAPAIGDTVALTAQALDDDERPVQGARITWGLTQRAAGGTASIGDDGRFVASAPGTYIVIASSGPAAARAVLQVAPRPRGAVARRQGADRDDRLKIEAPDVAPYVGTSMPLKALLSRRGEREPLELSSIRWESDRPDVASIGDDGTLTFLTPGKVTITADDGVLQLTRKFTVLPNPGAKLVMMSGAGEVYVGDVVKLNVQIWARGGMPVKDARPNFAVVREDGRPPNASVDDEGVFIAREPGVYTIVVELGGLTDRATIVVRQRE